VIPRNRVQAFHGGLFRDLNLSLEPDFDSDRRFKFDTTIKVIGFLTIKGIHYL